MLEAPVADCKTCPLGAINPERCPFTPSQLPAGSVLCAQGEVPQGVHFVRDGLVSLCNVEPDGVERGLSVRGPRSMLCTESLSRAPSLFEVRSLSDVKLCTLAAASFNEWIGPVGSPARTTLGFVLAELSCVQRLLSFRERESLPRVAALLLAGWLEPLLAHGLQKQEVARLLDMRPETLSRCLRQLADRGLIDAATPGVPLDRAGLERLAQGEPA